MTAWWLVFVATFILATVIFLSIGGYLVNKNLVRILFTISGICYALAYFFSNENEIKWVHAAFAIMMFIIVICAFLSDLKNKQLGVPSGTITIRMNPGSYQVKPFEKMIIPGEHGVMYTLITYNGNQYVCQRVIRDNRKPITVLYEVEVNKIDDQPTVVFVRTMPDIGSILIVISFYMTFFGAMLIGRAKLMDNEELIDAMATLTVPWFIILLGMTIINRIKHHKLLWKILTICFMAITAIYLIGSIALGIQMLKVLIQ